MRKKRLRCISGPWAGKDRDVPLGRFAPIEVPGHPEGRYVGWPTRDPLTLVWSTNREAW